MQIINTKIIQAVLDDDYKWIGGVNKIYFANNYGIREEDIPDFKFPGYNAVELKKALSDVIDDGFQDILARYKKILPEATVLRHDNSISSDGRHISPGIVSITDVVASILYVMSLMAAIG